MADLSITAASVVPVTGYQYLDGTAGETITAGMACYQSAADSKFYKADNDHATENNRTVKGVALAGAANGQPLRVITDGEMNIGATLTVGEIYVLSSTAGGVCPEGDLGSGDYVSIIGIASSASNLKLAIFNSGAAVP